MFKFNKYFILTLKKIIKSNIIIYLLPIFIIPLLGILIFPPENNNSIDTANVISEPVVMYEYSCRDTDDSSKFVNLRNFDPTLPVSTYMDIESEICFFPFISITITNTTRSIISIPPFMLIHQKNASKIPNNINYHYVILDIIRENNILPTEYQNRLSPYQDEFFGAILDSTNGNSENIRLEREFFINGYINLLPGETKELPLRLFTSQGYEYIFNVGVLYKKENELNINWSDDSFIATGYSICQKFWQYIDPSTAQNLYPDDYCGTYEISDAEKQEIIYNKQEILKNIEFKNKVNEYIK